VQLKPLTWSAGLAAGAASSSNCNSSGGESNGVEQPDQQQQQQQQQVSVEGLGQPVLQEVLLILKYGGVLTHAGRAQAEELGKVYRLVMYPRCADD
jgi:hypothetical protein